MPQHVKNSMHSASPEKTVSGITIWILNPILQIRPLSHSPGRALALRGLTFELDLLSRKVMLVGSWWHVFSAVRISSQTKCFPIVPNQMCYSVRSDWATLYPMGNSAFAAGVDDFVFISVWPPVYVNRCAVDGCDPARLDALTVELFEFRAHCYIERVQSESYKNDMITAIVALSR